MDTLIAIIIIFGVLVAVHEWGHLYFAKKAGILCREFAIGFGPKIFSTKRNERSILSGCFRLEAMFAWPVKSRSRCRLSPAMK